MENLSLFEEWDAVARNRAHKSVPREPDENLRDAFVHIAFASWSNTWENKGLTSLVRWVVVSHDIRTSARFHIGSSRSAHPMEDILADIHRALSEAGASAWVAVPSKRGGVAARLHEMGVPVTRGLDRENRAVDILISTMASESKRQNQAALRGGLLYPDQPAAPRKAEPVATTLETAEHHWWPEFRNIRSAHATQMVVAADASLDRYGTCGLGVVSDRGDVAMRSLHSETKIGQMEFEGIILALELISDAHADHATVVSDSNEALLMARTLAANLVPDPGYCGISEDARVRFLQAYASLDANVEFKYVRGHVGHPLNEAADDLANLARLAAKQPRHLVEEELWRRVGAVCVDVRSVGRIRVQDAANRP